MTTLSNQLESYFNSLNISETFEKHKATLPKESISFIRSKYHKIYNWYKTLGAEAFEQYDFDANLNADVTDQFFSTLDILPDPDKASVKEIISCASEVLDGNLSYVVELSESDFFLKKEASRILEIGKHHSVSSVRDIQQTLGVKKLPFVAAATSKVMSDCPELRNLLHGETRYPNLGGLIAFLESNAMFSMNKIGTPFLVGFEVIDDRKALVNQVIKGVLEICEIKLGVGDPYTVFVKIRNNIEKPIDFKIPKGQIFENKSFLRKTQNLALIDPIKHSIPANSERSFTLDCTCINSAYGLPEGSKGNLTIFKISNKVFRSDRDIWRYMNKLSSLYSSKPQLFKNFWRWDSVGYRKERLSILLAILCTVSASITAYFYL